jgi:hypothetical protein
MPLAYADGHAQGCRQKSGRGFKAFNAPRRGSCAKPAEHFSGGRSDRTVTVRARGGQPLGRQDNHAVQLAWPLRRRSFRGSRPKHNHQLFPRRTARPRPHPHRSQRNTPPQGVDAHPASSRTAAQNSGSTSIIPRNQCAAWASRHGLVTPCLFDASLPEPGSASATKPIWF